MRPVVVLSLVVFLAFPLAAQTAARPDVAFTPARPAPGDVAFVEVTLVAGCTPVGLTKVGDDSIESRLTLGSCTGDQQEIERTYSAELGSLTAGTYSYKLYVDDVLVDTRTIEVEKQRNALAPITLGALALMVIGFALVRMR